MSDTRPNPHWEALRSMLVDVFENVENGALLYAQVIERVEPLVMSATSVGIAGEPMMRQSWQQLHEREHEQRVESDKWRTIVADLDRCEHGRHEGDDCGSCGGPSQGNPLLQAESYIGAQRVIDRLGVRPTRLVGFGLDASPICVPERPQPGEPGYRADDYYRRDLR